MQDSDKLIMSGLQADGSCIQADKTNLPVGFMDSGLGGLSVLREALKLMPSEDFIYYGDSKNAPYGTKTSEEVRDLTFAVVDKLMNMGIKGLVVACNTATSVAVRLLREKYPDMPIVGIEPAIKPAVVNNRGGKILVMATPMTIKREKFLTLLHRYQEQAEIEAVPCEGLMEFVEHGNLDGNDLDAYFKKHLEPYLTDDTETIVLGCTHYPFLRPHLKAYLKNRDINIIDGSLGTCRELKRRLGVKNLLRTEECEGKVLIYNSIDTQEMIDLSERLLKMDID